MKTTAKDLHAQMYTSQVVPIVYAWTKKSPISADFSEKKSDFGGAGKDIGMKK